MRKLMNKKGFSLVELMIVVVIMGILIAVAIPLYGAITKNANNKTCATNIKNIKSAATTYFSSYDQKPIDKASLENMMEENKLPVCPLGGAYGIKINARGAAVVYCNNTKDSHAPDGNATAEEFGAANAGTELQAAGTAVTN